MELIEINLMTEFAKYASKKVILQEIVKIEIIIIMTEEEIIEITIII